MRYPADHKHETRRKILEAATRQFKTHGISGAGVATIMKAADLTHGGFYAHFSSKDELVRAVLRKSIEDAIGMWEERLAGLDDDAWLEGWVSHYLSDGHLEKHAEGCPVPPLVSELSRGEDALHEAFDAMAGSYVEMVAARVAAPPEEARRRARAAIAISVGALSLARSIGKEQAHEYLEAAREGALDLLRGGRTTPEPRTDGSEEER